MSSKINIRRIISNHLDTLKEADEEHISKTDIVVFFGVPTLAGAVVTWLFGSLNFNFITIAAASLSIFAALLFNLLLLIYDVVKKPEIASTSEQAETKRRLLKEIYNNISFAILVAVTTVALLMAFTIPSTSYAISQLVGTFFSFISYLLIFTFLLTTYMILKRIHTLLSHEFDA